MCRVGVTVPRRHWHLFPRALTEAVGISRMFKAKYTFWRKNTAILSARIGLSEQVAKALPDRQLDNAFSEQLFCRNGTIAIFDALQARNESTVSVDTKRTLTPSRLPSAPLLSNITRNDCKQASLLGRLIGAHCAGSRIDCR